MAPNVMARMLFPVMRILTVLVFIPAIVTYFHFRHIIFSGNYCFVSKTKSNQFYNLQTGVPVPVVDGIYYKQDTKGTPWNEFSTNRESFHQIFHSDIQNSSTLRHLFNYGWPSAPVLAYDIRKISSNSYHEEPNPNIRHELTFIQDKKTRCISDPKREVDLFCSRHNTSSSTIHTNVPTFDSYVSTEKSFSEDERVVHCPYKSFSHRLLGRNRNIKFVLSFPTTAFITLLNISLAFYYWNYRILPNDVAKSYEMIVMKKEIWRAYTGAFAHFDLLHLGFNMMSFVSLGEVLEDLYGSLPFLVINIFLVAMTTTLMMIATKIRIRHAHSDIDKRALRERPTVGYSGVLFAWMVVVSMKRTENCPIFFLPSFCFRTYHFFGGYLPINMAPLVQLIVMQIIIRNASFVGHLSGIICGFVFNLGILRVSVCAPHVCSMVLILTWLRKVEGVDLKKVMCTEKREIPPPSHGRELQSQDHFEAQTHDNYQRWMLLMRIFCKKDRLWHLTSYALFAITFLSTFFFDWGLIFAQLICCLLFYAGTITSSSVPKQKQRSYPVGGIILRSHLIASIVTVITDSMSFAAFCVTKTFISTYRYIPLAPSDNNTTFIIVLLALVVRVTLNVGAMILVTKELLENGETSGGPFQNQILTWLVMDVSIIVNSLSSSTFTAFDGQGFILGSSNDDEDGIMV